VAAGAKGIVAAAFAPGMLVPAELAAFKEAVAAGVVVALATRAGSGRAFASRPMREAGLVSADNLTPQKARVLLALALTRTSDPARIRDIFATH
jgi:L-asparaginase